MLRRDQIPSILKGLMTMPSQGLQRFILVCLVIDQIDAQKRSHSFQIEMPDVKQKMLRYSSLRESHNGWGSDPNCRILYFWSMKSPRWLYWWVRGASPVGDHPESGAIDDIRHNHMRKESYNYFMMLNGGIGTGGLARRSI